MTEELISFASKQDMLAKSSSSGTRTRPSSGSTPGSDLVIDRREGYFIYDVEGKRLIDVHLNGGTYNLGHRNPEVVGRGDRGHAALRHRQPPLPGAGPHRAGRGAGHRTAPPSLHKVIYGSGGGEADRHRAQERAARRPEAQDRLDRQGLPRPHRAGRGHRRRPVRDACSWPTGRTSSATCRSTTCDAMEAALRGPGRGRRDHGDDPGHLRLPAARARLPGRRSSSSCERYGALYIADEVQTGLMRTGELWAITKHGVEPGHPGHRQGHLRRHVPDQRACS